MMRFKNNHRLTLPILLMLLTVVLSACAVAKAAVEEHEADWIWEQDIQYSCAKS